MGWRKIDLDCVPNSNRFVTGGVAVQKNPLAPVATVESDGFVLVAEKAERIMGRCFSESEVESQCFSEYLQKCNVSKRNGHL